MAEINKETSAVLVLSHLMDANDCLDEESVARAQLAASVFVDKGCDFLVTSGWNYRDDSESRIGDVVSKYLEKYCNIKKEKILVDTFSRDTVGDAFFVKRNIVIPRKIGDLIVITSDYHMGRARFIFEKFFLPHVEVSVLGVETEANRHIELLEQEANSIDAFNKTFEGVDFQDEHSVYSALVYRHPFYNGDVYEKVAFN